MRVVTNTRLAKRNRQWAQYLFFASFGLLILGLFVTNRQLLADQSANLLLDVILPTAVLPLAFIMTIVSVRMTNLWARQPRPESAIEEGLKGIPPKTTLFNYYHFPARHVLICPAGVFAIATRFQDGIYSCHGDVWRTSRKSLVSRLASLFRFDGVGNPTSDALRAAEHVQSIMKSVSIDVEVKPLVVFVDPRVTLNIQDPVVPVCHSSTKHPFSLKDYLYTLGKDRKFPLSQEQIDAFAKASSVV
jgi:hypothetical protein